MKNHAHVPKRPAFRALKTRLEIEAFFIRNNIQAEIAEQSITLPSLNSRSVLHLKDTPGDGLDLTLAVINPAHSPATLTRALSRRRAAPKGTALQVLQFDRYETPAFLAQRSFHRSLQSLAVIRWCAACEGLIPGHSPTEGFAGCQPAAPNTPATPELIAAAKTSRALLDCLLGRFGPQIRVTGSCGPTSCLTSYGLPYGDAYFQFAVLPVGHDSCQLSVNVFLGRLFNRRPEAIEWILRNCVGKFLTWRIEQQDPDEKDLQIGFHGFVPCGASPALTHHINRILEEGIRTAGCLGIWFPNVITGDTIGKLLHQAHHPDSPIAINAVSDPHAFVEQLKQALAAHPLSESEMQLSLSAAIWASQFETAIEWAESLETKARASPPTKQEEKRSREAVLSFCSNIRVRALKALGRYDEALVVFEQWADSPSRELDPSLHVAKAVLFLRLRRLDEAWEIIEKVAPTAGVLGLLTRAVIAVGLGRGGEAQTALRLYEEFVGEDVAARALFAQLENEHLTRQNETNQLYLSEEDDKT